jgi:hypothetical protein
MSSSDPAECYSRSSLSCRKQTPYEPARPTSED